MSASTSPPPSPSQQVAVSAAAAAHAHAHAHAYASNGLEILQAASDAAAHANRQALQDAAAAAAEHVSPLTQQSLPPPPPPPPPQQQQQQQQQHEHQHQQQQQHEHQQQQQQHEHQQQQQQHDALPPPHQHPSLPPHQQHQQQLLAAAPGAVMRDPTINPKLTRLRRACDMCSMRKVKCDDSTIPCKPCRELGVDCTSDRETKRRGPPNKHAEAAKAAKRARAASAVSPAAPLTAAVPSPRNAAKTLLDISSEAALDAESIAPMPVLELLVDDFFAYLHPLAPFPHEPTFRESFASRDDRTRPEFLALLASMIAALVASFPRSAREHLKSQHGVHLFPKAVVVVERCRDIALHARGGRWVLKQPKSLDDAAASYFLGLASAHCHQWNASRHFMAETLTLIRELGFSRPAHPGDLPTFGDEVAYSPDAAEAPRFNHVKDETGKRIFWCLLLAVRSFSQLGASHSDLIIAPSTPSLPYPAYPENVDDVCVVARDIVHQPDGAVTLLTGFRFAIDIYTTMNGVVSLELAYGMSTLPWPDQRLLLRDGLLAAKGIIDNLPPELQLGSHADADDADSLANLDDSGLQYVPPLWPEPQPAHDIRVAIKAEPSRRRRLQYEIQKANLFVSQLATRSYFVELYFNLRDVYLRDPQQQAMGQSDEESALRDADDKDILDLMSQERELLVQNLLTVLGLVSQRNLEPNGGSIISKIRQLASTLLADAPERKGPFALKAEEALSELVAVLLKLEGTGFAADGRAPDPSLMTAEDEEDELRHWADLREHQLRFAANGSYAADL
ncbi:hypothetical protein RJ55_04258 [Drechmeria coniospora]|nr:hypothetical protein RJ55_04258 [Drechmeria coniospora]